MINDKISSKIMSKNKKINYDVLLEHNVCSNKVPYDYYIETSNLYASLSCLHAGHIINSLINTYIFYDNGSIKLFLLFLLPSFICGIILSELTNKKDIRSLTIKIAFILALILFFTRVIYFINVSENDINELLINPLKLIHFLITVLFNADDALTRRELLFQGLWAGFIMSKSLNMIHILGTQSISKIIFGCYITFSSFIGNQLMNILSIDIFLARLLGSISIIWSIIVSLHLLFFSIPCYIKTNKKTLSQFVMENKFNILYLVLAQFTNGMSGFTYYLYGYKVNEFKLSPELVNDIGYYPIRFIYYYPLAAISGLLIFIIINYYKIIDYKILLGISSLNLFIINYISIFDLTSLNSHYIVAWFIFFYSAGMGASFSLMYELFNFKDINYVIGLGSTAWFLGICLSFCIDIIFQMNRIYFYNGVLLIMFSIVCLDYFGITITTNENYLELFNEIYNDTLEKIEY